ncbi:MAG: hypothetical protein QM541_12200 [Flavobacterium sp.]|nr:hypothetical protein [Flavobacterium sp.]
MALQEQKIKSNNATKKVDNADLTRKLFESQSAGLTEIYSQLSKNISIISILKKGQSFQRTNNKTLRQICSQH